MNYVDGQIMKIACCQVNTVWENKSDTHARVAKLLDAANLERGTLVVLPEFFSVGFSFNVAKIAEGKHQETETFMAQTAKRLGIFLMGGVVNLGDDNKGRNEAVVFDPGGKEVARYCKLHPFSFSGEDQHYEPGNNVIVFNCHQWLVAPLICYDLRFPEAFRAAVRRGAELIVVMADWPQQRQDHWQALLPARAIENQAYIVAVNRCGDDPNHTYVGGSQVINPQGQIIADAGSTECVVTAEIDHSTLIQYRQQFPALKDIRDDLVPTPEALK